MESFKDTLTRRKGMDRLDIVDETSKIAKAIPRLTRQSIIDNAHNRVLDKYSLEDEYAMKTLDYFKNKSKELGAQSKNGRFDEVYEPMYGTQQDVKAAEFNRNILEDSNNKSRIMSDKNMETQYKGPAGAYSRTDIFNNGKNKGDSRREAVNNLYGKEIIKEIPEAYNGNTSGAPLAPTPEEMDLIKHFDPMYRGMFEKIDGLIKRNDPITIAAMKEMGVDAETFIPLAIRTIFERKGMGDYFDLFMNAIDKYIEYSDYQELAEKNAFDADMIYKPTFNAGGRSDFSEQYRKKKMTDKDGSVYTIKDD